MCVRVQEGDKRDGGRGVESNKEMGRGGEESIQLVMSVL
jgi:hypothetical protein